MSQNHARHSAIRTSTGTISSVEVECGRAVQKAPMSVNTAELNVRKNVLAWPRRARTRSAPVLAVGLRGPKVRSGFVDRRCRDLRKEAGKPPPPGNVVVRGHIEQATGSVHEAIWRSRDRSAVDSPIRPQHHTIMIVIWVSAYARCGAQGARGGGVACWAKQHA